MTPSCHGAARLATETRDCIPAAARHQCSMDAAMPKPKDRDIPLASLRCPPEALPGRPETADMVAAA